MAISYFQTASWGTAGTNSGVNEYKDLAITGVATGDLLVVFAICENYGNNTGTRSISTIAGGATTGAWTTVQPAVVRDGDIDIIGGYALATSAGTVTVRGQLRENGGRMGVAAIRIPAAEVGATYAWVGTGFVGDADGQSSATLSADSLVLYGAGDWSAITMGSTTTPSGGTVHANYSDGTNYSLWVTSWTAQAAGTRNYGPSGLTGHDVSGAIFRMDTAASGTSYDRTPADNVSITDSVTPALAAPRSSGDSLGVSDSVSTTQALVREPSDSVGVSDAVEAVLTGPSTEYSEWGTANFTVENDVSDDVDDAVGVTDSASATLDAIRDSSDAVGVSDQVVAILAGPNTQYSEWGTANFVEAESYEGTPADSVGITDSVVAELARVISVSIADGIGITDTDADQEISSQYDLDENVGVTDVVVYVTAASRTASDAVGLTDSVSVQLVGSNSAQVDNPVGITDQVTTTLVRHFTVLIEDGVGIADVAIGAENVVIPVVPMNRSIQSVTAPRVIVMVQPTRSVSQVSP